MTENNDNLSRIVAEFKEQLAAQGKAIAEIVDEYSQNSSAHEKLDDATATLRHGQTYLENLIDETAAEMDMIKRDMATITSEVKALKKEMRSLAEKQPKFAVTLDNRLETSTRSSSIPPIQRRILSSIPPRHLSENEAMELLKAVDRIVGGRVSEAPEPL